MFEAGFTMTARDPSAPESATSRSAGRAPAPPQRAEPLTKPSRPAHDAAVTGTLTPEDLSLHLGLGIEASVLARYGVRRVNDGEARFLLSVEGGKSRDMSGVVYPYHDPRTNQVVTHRLRRDRPEMEDGKPRNKYIASPRDRRHLYFVNDGPDSLNDTSVPVLFVEAEKSALVAGSYALRTKRPIVAIATGGKDGWRGRVGRTEAADGGRVDETGPLPDLDLLELRGRRAVIWFDGNPDSNPDVLRSERALVREVQGRGAHVFVARMPGVAGVNGPDDYRGATDDDAFDAVLAGAAPVRVTYESAREHLEAAGVHSLAVDISAADLESRLRLLADTLRGADLLRRRTVREAAVGELKKANVSGAAALVDAAMATPLGGDMSAAPTDILDDDEPWAEPVDGAALLDELVEVVRRHVVLPSADSAYAIALWVLVAWCEESVSILPLLAFTSPTKRCGKSTALAVMEALVRKPLSVSGISAAALFRSVEKWHPTLLIDEADTVLPANDELRGVLNAGHTRAAAAVVRCVGESLEPRRFSVWCPKVIAMIGRPPDTVADRSIIIELRRKTPADRVARLRLDTIRGELAPLRQRIRRWTDDNRPLLTGADPAMPTLLHDRAVDNWRSMVAIAELVGGEWPDRSRAAATVISGTEDEGDLPIGVQLLMDIGDVWPTDAAWMATAELRDLLLGLNERPWKTFGKQGTGLNQHTLSRMLSSFKVHVDAVKDHGKKRNVYRWAQLQEAIERYAPARKPEPRNFADGRRENLTINPERGTHGGSDHDVWNRQQLPPKFRGSGSEDARADETQGETVVA